MSQTAVIAAGQSHFPMGYGTGGVDAKLAKFLGPVNGQVRQSAYDKVNVTNYDLPEYYKGKNLFLRDTIDGFILEDNEWYTTVCLPWAFSDQMSIEWNEWKFNHVMAGRVPHEGVSRMVTSSKREFKNRVVRRGLAFMLEADFYNTPEGEEHYGRNITGIAQCVQSTQNQDTIFALLTCKDYNKIWEEKFGNRDVIPFKSILENEVADYACAAHDKERLDISIENGKKVMNKSRVVPDLIVFTSGMQIYLTMAAGKPVEYWGMANGALEFKQGPTSLGNLRGMNVFESREFEEDGGGHIDLMTRRFQIGERYEMVFRNWRSNNISNYESKWRDIFIYDENSDEMKKITFRKSFEYINTWTKNGAVLSMITDMIDRRNDTRVDHSQKRKRDTARDFNEAKPPHFLITSENDNRWILAEYFGQMHSANASASDFRQVGQTVVSKFFGRAGNELIVWEDMLKLFEQIENQGYDQTYWNDLIAANLHYSTNNGAFVGENTPADLKENWKALGRIREWVPNSHGSLNLPDRGNVMYPAGFANGPGLLTIAAEESNPNSTWKNISARASAVVDMLTRFIAILKRVFPESEALKEENRSPWFHRADSLTVFIENIVSIPRDPIWIASLATSDLGSANGSERNSSIRWDVKRLNGDQPGAKEVIGDEEGLLATAISFPTFGNGVVAFPLTGLSIAASKYMIALRYMGQYSYASLKNIVTSLTSTNDKPVREKLLSFIVGYASAQQSEEKIQKLRKIIRGLEARPNNLAENISVLCLPEKPNKSQRSAANKLVKSLTSEFEEARDEDYNSDAPEIGKKFTSSPSPANEELVNKIMEIVDVIDDDVKAAGASTFVASTSSDWFTVSTESMGGEVTKKLAALKKLTAQLESKLGKPSSEGSSSRIGTPMGRVVEVSGEASQFYRSPLTMSLTLLETMAEHPDALIRPSDHRTGHVSFYNANEGGESNIPDDLYHRSNYANITNVIHKDSIRTLASTTMIQKHIGYSADGSSQKTSYKPIAKKTKFQPSGRQVLFGNHDDEDSMEEEDGEEDTAQEWNMDRLKKKGARYDLKTIYSDGYDKLLTGTFSERYAEANKIGDSILRAAVMVVLMSPLSKDQCERMIDNNIHLPINILLWRLFIEHDMSSAIMLKGGLETGANLYGHSNFATGSDVATKVIYGNFTFNSKAMVWKSQNVFIMENIKPQTYQGGNNIRFMTSSKDISDTGVDRPSIIATAIPITDDDFPWAMSFLGRHAIRDSRISISAEEEQTLHYSSAPYYAKFYDIEQAMGGYYIGDRNYVDCIERLNTVAMQGLQFSYNTASGKYDKVTECKGHRKRNGSGTGCAAVWNGQAKSFKEQVWANYLFD